MKKILSLYLKAFFGKEQELRVKLFHVLAITGFIICVVMTGVSIAGEMPVSAWINAGAGAVSLALLIYSARSGRYRFCYWATIGVIFFVLFPSMFFFGGGYHGGMPFFFVFAVVFTVYMLDGWGMLAVTLIEMTFYSVLCILAYQHPEAIVPFESEQAVLTDVIIGLVTVSISLGATMFVQVRMYQRQQKELEKARVDAEAASRAKSSFLANMSHEIRTPIHMILGMNEIIHREGRSRQVRDYSEKIEETGKMLLALINNVLDVSKIESGKMELSAAPYESRELLETLELIGKTQCAKKKLRFCYRAEELPPVLLGDLAHIRQIASNFLSNAAKYTETGSVTLTASEEPGKTEDEILLCISVRDTGTGIKKESLDTLFDAFSRAGENSRHYIEGTGLGLAIVKQLTELMQGEIFVKSELGLGSTFTVKLPQKIIRQEESRNPVQPMTFEAPNGKILVVDDNEGNRMIMRELLSSTRVMIDTAGSGEECVEMVRDNSYHVILMDYMMPKLDGLETLQQLQKLPGFQTPVVALTADASAETEKKLMQGGFSAFLTKPIPWLQLRDTLLSFLPENLVELVPEGKTESANMELRRELKQKLEPYGVDVEEAMQYFRDSLREYRMMADLFLRHSGSELKKVSRFETDRDCSQLRFPIHTLKGKARNLGITRLGEVCAHVEQLCIREEKQEIQSLLPYLMYLWQKGLEGMEQLVKALADDQNQHASGGFVDGDCCEQLLQLLREFRRKPSLECIAQIRKGESTAEGIRRLEKTAGFVDAISFEEAEKEFEAYIEWKEEGEE